MPKRITDPNRDLEEQMRAAIRFLSDYRRDHDMTQRALSQSVHRCPGWVNQIEVKSRRVGLEALATYAEGLGFRVCLKLEKVRELGDA